MSEPDPSRIATRVAEVRAEIADACRQAGRDPDSVALVAVTKNQDPGVLPALRAAGVHDFGENRVDHLMHMHAYTQAGDRWHYIGRVQGRQLPQIAPVVQVLHSLCDPGHFDRLSRTCVEQGVCLPVYLQANTSGEAAKAGLRPEEVPGLVARLRALPGIDLIGLMCMAPELGEMADEFAVRACFAGLRTLATASSLPGLSMGMSGDFSIAVAEGATVVRVGSRLFA
jgi:PLP dependent protein